MKAWLVEQSFTGDMLTRSLCELYHKEIGAFDRLADRVNTRDGGAPAVHGLQQLRQLRICVVLVLKHHLGTCQSSNQYENKENSPRPSHQIIPGSVPQRSRQI